MKQNNKKTVIIVTGYLGSGKTTLMQNLLRQESRKITLIVNDMGSINIDAALLEKKRPKHCTGGNGGNAKRLYLLYTS